MRIELRQLSILFLFFFIFTTVSEARNTSVSHRSTHVTKQQVKTTRHQKRTPPGLMTKKKQTVSKVKTTHQTGKLNSRKTLQAKKPKNPQTKVIKKSTQHVSVTKKKSVTQNKRPRQKLINKPLHKRPVVPVKKSSSPLAFNKRTTVVKKNQSKIVQKKLSQQPQKSPQSKLHSAKPGDYLSQLNPHTQKNARIGRLDTLFSKKHLGQDQTIALIELSGEWDEMRDVVKGKEGHLPPAIRENYKWNFLPPIGDLRVDPNAKIDRSHSLLSASSDYYKHGSRVSSVLLDLASHAKVLPVSTYETPTKQSYDIADALIALSKRSDVSVINISSGSYSFDLKTSFDQDYKLITNCSFFSRDIEAIKAVIASGKVIVYAAGNEGIEYQDATISRTKDFIFEKYRLYLLENLDEETRKSIIFAGNLDPNTLKLHQSSTRPGTLKCAQDVFLYAPGEMELSYKPYIHRGTSFSAPYICAAIANLCSRSAKITPKQAVRALLETADKQPDVRTYGRGIINAARALDWLERDILK